MNGKLGSTDLLMQAFGGHLNDVLFHN